MPWHVGGLLQTTTYHLKLIISQNIIIKTKELYILTAKS